MLDPVTAHPSQTPKVSRRSFLSGLAGLSAAGLLAAPLNAAAGLSADRRLRFRHTHTLEKLDLVYFSEGQYVHEAMTEMNYFFRDHRTGEPYPMDPQLFDILHSISLLAPKNCCFQVISGYRSPETNFMLRRKSRGVAKFSLHMVGKAIDVRLPEIRTKTLRNIAVSLKQGGVGYYRKSDFVHIDTGKIRTW